MSKTWESIEELARAGATVVIGYDDVSDQYFAYVSGPKGDTEPGAASSAKEAVKDALYIAQNEAHLLWGQTYPNPEEQEEADVEVRRDGDMYLFTFLTPEAVQWRDEHIPADATYWGNELVVERRRFAVDVAQGMMNDGLVVV